jgi:predicted adenylyl cyclase CyaB
MPRNIELKARLRNPARAAAVAAEVATSGPTELIQCDTYFVCAHGRLKLRQHACGRAELIWYQREDALGARPSQYEIVEVRGPQTLHATLAGALGIDTIVKKRRQLWLVDHVRIHLDDVEGLGHFLELEAVLDEKHNNPEEAARFVEELAERLGMQTADRIARSYREMV